MNCFKKICTYYFYLDWYTATNISIEDLISSIQYYDNISVDDFIIKFIYKQHHHYFRYINHVPYTYVHNHHSNSVPLVYTKHKLFIASDINSNYTNNNLATPIPVIIPDYSNVDVGVGKQWPSKVFAPFVDSTAWPPYSLVDSYNASKTLYYNLGFIVSKSATVCEPTWGTYYTGEAGPLNDQIKAIRNLGGDVAVSFGGAANVPLHIVAPTTTDLFNQYKAFTMAYGLTRIDFDLEGTWIAPPYTNANILNSQAIKMLQDYYKSVSKNISIWFTLPVLPTGLTPDGLNILQLALNAGVDIGGVNVMTMDYGDYAAPNPQGQMGSYGIQAITSLQSQLKTLYNGSKTDSELWAMIGTTPMIGVNDVQDEVFTQSDATQTVNFANTKNIGLISMWSSNRDTTSQSRIPQTDYEFAKIFNQYS